MNSVEVIRDGALAAAGLVIALTTVSYMTAPPQCWVMADGRPHIGGPFRVVTHTGAMLVSRVLQGKLLVVFFGFTHFPGVCPTALASLSQLMVDLGPDADGLQVVFFTVDSNATGGRRSPDTCRPSTRASMR
ncbi:cytochrome oxidase Cu insertion factor (SCO1/SenC/PrrC family) [Methylorubrum rhodinum]|jgi:protein SCO1/2|uniref:Cytochrome oxidase Cu insertion factor (SCO1/SenC/PrrC family) n=2 Tax=Methylorubrum TaxID=2282523 RepID=A0A840ZLW0_9HYPH|nr:SCO family protein [Methylorubrum rhodinum]MBB5758586.1 cytochrome oxidase Cu insertion factor (SCO1/SenC/PrrC family) [Methylorubrum rhodinum]